MKGLDTYVNCFLNGTEEDGPDIKYIFSVINLCENSELQAYDDSFSNAKIAVAETVSSVVKDADKVGRDHIKDTANVTDDSCSLIDIRDDWAIDNYPLPFVALQMQECIFHYSKSLSLHCGCSKRHYYFVQDDAGAKLKSLTLTVVFHGSFDGPKYDPGTLSVELRRVTNIIDQQTQIGSTPQELQVPNTKDRLGRIIIKHESSNYVVQGGLFEVEVTAKQGRDVSYSVTVGGRLACPLMKEVKRQLAGLIAKRREIIECIHQSTLLKRSLVLLERKKTIESKLIDQTKKKREICKAEMEALDLELDKQDEMKDSTVQQIIQKMGALKTENDTSCRLISLR